MTYFENERRAQTKLARFMAAIHQFGSFWVDDYSLCTVLVREDNRCRRKSRGETCAIKLRNLVKGGY
ncbi:hypothetical protein [Aquitalea sp. LB_tupeE]|uniref:hypothetical protein n=1 Tax=Aquitalea sp. LB_tupeE TaxID=2748078 RepID=UPI0015BFCD94|nr:hypothetical protein [Aquitalea sp. LB_tupeE]NWK76861.1 hypothetical protein [Aquitalea sp. LB_tupeE]